MHLVGPKYGFFLVWVVVHLGISQNVDPPQIHHADSNLVHFRAPLETVAAKEHAGKSGKKKDRPTILFVWIVY